MFLSKIYIPSLSRVFFLFLGNKTKKIVEEKMMRKKKEKRERKKCFFSRKNYLVV